MGKGRVTEIDEYGRFTIQPLVRQSDGTTELGEPVVVWCLNHFLDHPEAIEVGDDVDTVEVTRKSRYMHVARNGAATEGEESELMAGASQTDCQWYVNTALLPGTRKWRPWHRYGRVLAVDYDAGTVDVGIYAAYDITTGLNINIEPDPEGVEDKDRRLPEKYWNLPISKWITELDLPDYGVKEFCRVKHPDHPVCTYTEPEELKYTPELWALMSSVQSDVNGNYSYQPDPEGLSDQWDLVSDKGEGDCEDFALEKMKRLADAGVPPGNLHIAIGQTEKGATGRNHAWLEVDTTLGTWVLDVGTSKVVPRRNVKYYNQTRVLPWALGESGIRYDGIPVRYCYDRQGKHKPEDIHLFTTGDDVVVKFEDYDWAKPSVIGFAANPRPCHGGYIKVIIGDYAVIWDLDTDSPAVLPHLGLDENSWPLHRYSTAMSSVDYWWSALPMESGEDFGTVGSGTGDGWEPYDTGTTGTGGVEDRYFDRPTEQRARGTWGYHTFSRFHPGSLKAGYYSPRGWNEIKRWVRVISTTPGPASIIAATTEGGVVWESYPRMDYLEYNGRREYFWIHQAGKEEGEMSWYDYESSWWTVNIKRETDCYLGATHLAGKLSDEFHEVIYNLENSTSQGQGLISASAGGGELLLRKRTRRGAVVFYHVLTGRHYQAFDLPKLKQCHVVIQGERFSETAQRDPDGYPVSWSPFEMPRMTRLENFVNKVMSPKLTDLPSDISYDQNPDVGIYLKTVPYFMEGD